MIRRLRLKHNILSKFVMFIAAFAAVAVICLCKYGIRLSVDEYGSYKSYAVGDVGVMEVHFIDVGQGDCTLITCDGEAMLIDAGGNSKGTAVQMYLMKHDIDRLEYVIGTHPDEDHIGGLDVIITKFDCDMIMLPDCESDSASYRDLEDAIEYKNYVVTSPAPGDSYSLGSAEFTIIAPNRQYEGTNNNSIGIFLEHGSNSYLFTGDCEKEAEQDILRNGIDINADVYKVAHHGSSTSSCEEFLEAVSPYYAVISCGEDNRYGHPHKEILKRLENAGITIYRTDLQGTIVSVSDGQNITWDVEIPALRTP